MMTRRKERPAGVVKVCSQCRVQQDGEEFLWKSREARFTARCRSCRKKNYKENPTRAKERSAEYYKTNKVAVLEQARVARRRDVAKNLWKQARKRAEQKNVPFAITESDIVVPSHCPVLGIELSVGDGKCHQNSPTLDRIVPSAGYVRGNIVVVSFRANTIKSDATLAELAAVLRFYGGLDYGKPTTHHAVGA